METSTSCEFEGVNSADHATYKLCDLEHHVVTPVSHAPHLQNEGLRWNTSKTPRLWIWVYRTAWHVKLIFSMILLNEAIKTAATIKKKRWANLFEKLPKNTYLKSITLFQVS